MKPKWNLDWIRLIAALLVVVVHTDPFADWNPTIDFLFTHVFCRIAVPIFLMITGYYVLPKSCENPAYLIRYTKKILKLYGICILLYLPVNIYTFFQTGGSDFSFFRDLLCNGTFYHLWYFPALLLGIWIVFFFLKRKEKIGVVVFFVLFLLGLLGDSYYGVIESLAGIKMFYSMIFSVWDYTRNGLFYVPIFLYLGYYFSKITWQLPKSKNILLFLYFLFCMELEGFLLNQLQIQRHDSMYILLIPVMIFLFPLLLRNQNSNQKIRNLAMWIYIIHPLMIIVVRGFAKVTHLESIFIEQNFLHFLCVMILSMGWGILINKLKCFHANHADRIHIIV